LCDSSLFEVIWVCTSVNGDCSNVESNKRKKKLGKHKQLKKRKLNEECTAIKEDNAVSEQTSAIGNISVV